MENPKELKIVNEGHSTWFHKIESILEETTKRLGFVEKKLKEFEAKEVGIKPGMDFSSYLSRSHKTPEASPGGTQASGTRPSSP